MCEHIVRHQVGGVSFPSLYSPQCVFLIPKPTFCQNIFCWRQKSTGPEKRPFTLLRQRSVAGGKDLVKYIRLKKEDNYSQCEFETFSFFLFVVGPIASSRMQQIFKYRYFIFTRSWRETASFLMSWKWNKMKIWSKMPPVGMLCYRDSFFSPTLIHPAESLSDGSSQNVQICDVTGSSCLARSV